MRCGASQGAMASSRRASSASMASMLTAAGRRPAGRLEAIPPCARLAQPIVNDVRETRRACRHIGEQMSFFVTGTDTGVGKTCVAALLVRALRAAGVDAVGFKPICCGGREDAEALFAASDGALALHDVNPV